MGITSFSKIYAFFFLLAIRVPLWLRVLCTPEHFRLAFLKLSSVAIQLAAKMEPLSCVFSPGFFFKVRSQRGPANHLLFG